MREKIAAFCKREAVLVISFLCAVVSMFFVPPSGAYLSYVDFRVLCLLFCLMAVVAGFTRCGLFAVLAEKLLCGRKNFRLLSLILVMLPFFTSMLITNDVALITFVPFTVLVLRLVGREKNLIYLVVLQTIAANLGSMTTPVGNPQNLFLYSHFSISIGTFFQTMLPLSVLSLFALAAASLGVKGEIIQVSFPRRQTIQEPRLLGLLLALFVLCLLCVCHLLHYLVVFALVVICLLLFARGLFPKVDYCLLLTFVCFFIFAGNMGNIPAVQQFLAGLLEKNTLLSSLAASQVISNVPAAVLLSGFSQDWQGLLLGTNIGGLGTMIASLASLISFKAYMRADQPNPGRYLLVFTVANVVGLVVLVAAAFVLM